MREILFRGRRKDYVPKLDDPEWMYWVCGDLVHNGNSGGTYIKPIGNLFRVTETGLAKLAIMHEVDPATIGQYTGLKDCDGRKIFEGDILEWAGYQPVDELTARPPSVVRFGAYNCTCCNGVYGWHLARGYGDIRDFEDQQDGGPYRVIGNVHDNPELLEV